ncbi:MAG: hypothetical protein ACYC6Y_27175 [Thermoguttaceae bacterium]
MMTVTARSRLGVFERRKLGLTFGNALRFARKLHDEGWLVGDDSQTAATQIAAAMVAENPDLYRTAVAESQRSWEEFFGLLISFLEKMMPLILQLIQIFSVAGPDDEGEL